MNDAAQIRKGRMTLLGLAALFFVPLAIAFYLYYVGGWRPAGSTVHGELITPARALERFAFVDPQGVAARADLLRTRWSLVYLGDGRCDQSCRDALLVLRQTRLALSNDMTRVQRIFIVTSGCCDTGFLDAEHPGLEVVSAEDPTARDFLAQFPATDRAHSVYVVDPLGNLMMRFDARQNPRGLLEDLEKLLKLSHIG
jgi:cytochrome oxidase Cu insertion factor (SCO1/SenC/PrrC family)